MGFVQRQLVKGVLWVVKHPRFTLAGAGVLLGVCVASAARWLTVSTDQNNLFSPHVRFFRDYLDFDRKFPENQAIYVVIAPADATAQPPVEQWVAAAEQIAARLRRMPQYVQSVLAQTPLDVPAAPGILFQDPKAFPDTVDQVKELIPLAQTWGEKPLFMAVLGRTPMARFMGGLSFHTPDAQTVQFLQAVCDGWLETVRYPGLPPQPGKQVPDLMTIGADDPSQLGYSYVTDQDPDRNPLDPPRHLLLISVYEKEDQSGLTTEADTIDAIRAAVAEEAAAFKQFTVEVTGRPVLDADQDRTTDIDGRRAEIIAMAVIFVGLVLLLRSIWLAVVAEASLAVAIGWTFGWATATVHQLNLLSTVFLIALIGIGMDYLIQILAAYRREARRYVRPGAVWARVFRYVGPPVNTACFGAAGAFLVSVFTDFRGAAELGIIAGGGLLLCLLSGYTVLPALLVLFPAKLKPYPASKRYGAAPRRTARRLAWPLIWIAALLAGIPFAMKANFNSNLLDLQAPNLPSVKLIRKLQAWEAVVLSGDLDVLRKVRDAVRSVPAVGRTESILDAYDNRAFLVAHASELPKIKWTTPTGIEPADLPDLAAHARGLADHLAAAGGADAASAAQSLREFANEIASAKADQAATAAALSAWQDVFVEQLKRLMAMLNPPPLQVSNIPRSIREHLASTVDQPKGQYVYALYIEPKEDLWKRDNLERFVTQVEASVAAIGGAPRVTGIAPDIYHSTAAIERAFYQATAYSLVLIFVLVLIDLRSLPHTLIAVSVLALGLPMLVALMGLFKVSWNFANFFALPILIGAGHEYGVFMMHRYKEAVHNPRRVWRRRDPADRALLLCAFVTCSSFAFFWALGHHKGLKSLGLVMALGTLCIYLATIAVVRPLLTWRLEHRRVRALAATSPAFEVVTAAAEAACPILPPSAAEAGN